VALSIGVKRPGREADNSHPSSTDVKNEWRYTSTTPIRFPGVVLSLKKSTETIIHLPLKCLQILHSIYTDRFRNPRIGVWSTEPPTTKRWNNSPWAVLWNVSG